MISSGVVDPFREIQVPVLNYNPTLEVKNEKEPGKDFSFTKVDEKGQGLSGAKFKLSQENDPSFSREAESDSNGKVSFTAIPLGTYILEEIKTPDGYENSNKVWKVIVSKDGVSYLEKVETTTTIPGGTKVQGESFDESKNVQVVQTHLKDTTNNQQGVHSKVTNIDNKANTFEQIIFVRQVQGVSKTDLNFTMTIPNGSNVAKYTSWSYGSAGSYNPNGPNNSSVDTSLTPMSLDSDAKMVNDKVSWNSTDNLLIVIRGEYDDTKTNSSLATNFLFNASNTYAGYSYELNGPYTISTSLPMTPGETVEVPDSTETKVTWEPVDAANMTDGNLKVTNKPNKIEFIKVNQDGEALKDAKFELRQKISDGSYSSLSPQITASSDENGFFAFEKISPGEYGVFETEAPEGYPDTEAEVAHFKVNEDGSISGVNSEVDKETQRYKVVNVKGKAEFSFKKVDGDKKPLEGVEFVLSGYSDQNGILTSHTSTSDKEGVISFKDLPLDSYYFLRETKTVPGYAIANNLWIVRIIKATTTDSAEIIRKGYKVELYNTGSLTPAVPYGPHPVIDGAWAKMNADKTKYVNVKTGAVQDLDAVSGATIKPQDLNDYGSWDKEKFSPETLPLTIVNKKADLLVQKRDEKGKPLDGAEFTLTLRDSSSGVSIVKESINGEVAYTDLKDGTYELTETKAPLGYDGTKDKWIVTVKDRKIDVKKDGADSGTGGTTPAGSPIENFGGNGIIGTTYSKTYPNYYTDLNIGTKIISADREKGTFEALVYVNNISAKAHSNSNIFIEGINPETYLGSSVKTLSSADIYQVSYNNVSAAMPSDFNIDLSKRYYAKVDSVASNKDKDISINLVGTTANYNAYVVKITGTYDKTSKSPISLKSTFNGNVYWNGYYYDSTAFVYNYISPSPWSPSDTTSPTDPTTDSSIGIGPDGKPTVTVTNTKRDPKGKVKIYKTGSDGKPLENVMFELKGPVITGQTESPKKIVTTDVNGEYLFENLQEGEYFLTEIQTVDGYLKTTQIWKIVVDKDGSTKILSGDSKDVTVETTTPTEPKDSNTTFPKYKGELNGKTQVSSPSETQKQTYYPSYPNPIVYTSENDGEYAADFDQTVESLRNPWLTDGSSLGNYGGYLTYQGNYQTTFNKDWHDMDFAKVAKYAEKTSSAKDDHNYDITLKLTGNTYPEKTHDKLGVIILYDNSNSMNVWVGNTGKTRTTLAKEATTNFVNDLSQKNPDTEFALITYGASVFDGRNISMNVNGATYSYTTGNYSYKDFTSTPTDITSKLPSTTPEQHYGSGAPLGSTFTADAFIEAQSLVQKAKARTTKKFDRLVIVNVTDGVPTISPIVASTDNSSGKVVTSFKPRYSPNYYYSGYNHLTVKGDGQFYYLRSQGGYNQHKPYYYNGTSNAIYDNGEPTLMAAQNVKNLDTEVFNIGIAVTGNNEVSNTTAKTLMANISSGAGYNYDLTNADNLPDAFNSIINSVYRNTISEGIVTDPMGDKVDLVVDGTFDSSDYTISATKDGVDAPKLLEGVKPKYDSTTRTIKLEGLNLGLGEEVIFKYKVALKADDPEVHDNVYYFTNGETTLEPNPSAGKVSWNFPVPSVKKIGEEPPQEVPKLTITNFKKPSVEFFKTTVLGDPLAGAKFQLYRKTTDIDGNATRMPVGGVVTVGKDGRIYFENLDVGNYELVETKAPVGYKKLDDPAVTFEVTDKGEVTNIRGKDLFTNLEGKHEIWNWRLPEMEVELKKLDGDLKALLEGNVEFKLTKASTNTTGGEVPSFLQTLSFTDLSQLQADGKTLKFNIPPEMDDEYILEETKAPDGYIRSFDKYHIMISQAERTIKLVKLTNVLGIEKDYKYKDPDGKEVSVKLSKNPITLYSEKEQEQGVKNDTLSLDFGVVNTKAVYPSTGGIGTLAFTIIGGAIMGGSFIKSRRRKEEEEEWGIVISTVLEKQL